ncbi:MAG TPA: universal stress protein [archaeon]|nr:universal stress protein [archaeon]
MFPRLFFAELIVMGTQGLTERDRFIRGRTVKRVVLSAPCPVVSIRAAA